MRGYHIYNRVWEAAIGVLLGCIREPSNVLDQYAVGVVKEGNIVGHLPKKFQNMFPVSSSCWHNHL